MFELPEIPFNALHALLFATAALVVGAVFLYRFIRAELCRRKCELCGALVSPEEHGHHVTVCALKHMLLREHQKE